jgi:hypothetical protein
MAVGETCTRLRLKKAVAVVGCVTCSRKLTKLKNYHPACCPPDINKAMGYDPAAHASATAGAAVPPPPKPKTIQDTDLEALSSLEAALLARARRNGITPAMDKAFKTFNNIKARVLRPGTLGEGEAATNVALKKIIDLVWGS